MKSKFFLLFVIFLYSAININAQSIELRDAFKQVAQTLREYTFSSEDVENSEYIGKTKIMSLKLQNGNFVMTINDSFTPFNYPIHGFGSGTKIIIVPNDEAIFNSPSYDKKCLIIGGENGIIFTYKNKKEMLVSYKLYGAELSIKKLLSEIQQLQSIAIEEDFQGSLGGNVTSSKKTSSQSKSVPQKKNNILTQPQPRQRNRVPAGN